jgi:antitoxin component of RelBE/YafQ-DinJ toxin-antitoxin module
MRTTLRLDDDLLIHLRKRANEEGLTLSEVVNLALRRSLASAKRRHRVFRQKTRDLGRPSFDVTKANAVAAALEDETTLRKLARSS